VHILMIREMILYALSQATGGEGIIPYAKSMHNMLYFMMIYVMSYDIIYWTLL
jgi:hypothetical protein